MTPATTPAAFGRIARGVAAHRSMRWGAASSSSGSVWKMLKVALIFGGRPAAFRQAMKRRIVSPMWAGSPLCVSRPTAVSGKSRMRTSA